MFCYDNVVFSNRGGGDTYLLTIQIHTTLYPSLVLFRQMGLFR